MDNLSRLANVLLPDGPPKSDPWSRLQDTNRDNLWPKPATSQRSSTSWFNFPSRDTAHSRKLQRFNFKPSWNRSDEPDYKVLKEWLDTCDKSHANCSREYARRLRSPHRLIDINQKCLVPGGGHYAALSYVWGNLEFFKTTRENFVSLIEPGALRKVDLPRTIHDAMIVCKNLGIPYLWVDALCITQDDATSKHSEILRMGDIYSNAYVTLIASTNTMEFDGLSRVSKRADYDPEREHSRWMSRGWTFQERFLAHRTIIFEVGRCLLNCGTCFWDESWIDTPFSSSYPPQDFSKDWRAFSDPDLDQFLSIAAEYNWRKLTFESDRNHAFKGVLTKLRPIYGPICFGLPQNYFNLSLLWLSADRYSTGKWQMLGRRKDSHVPSWSWMAWEGHIYPKSWGGSSYQKLDQAVKWRAGPDVEISDTIHEDCSFLYGRVERQYLSVTKYPCYDERKNKSSEWLLHVLAPMHGILVGSRICGLVQFNNTPNNSSDEVCFEFIKLSRGPRCPPSFPDLSKHFSLSEYDLSYLDTQMRRASPRAVSSTRYEAPNYYYNVMVVECREGIDGESVTYRRGLGWILADSWYAGPLESVNIILG